MGENTLSAGAFSSLSDDIVLLLLGSAGPHNLADNREAPGWFRLRPVPRVAERSIASTNEDEEETDKQRWYIRG